jgi:NADH dehydrogenase
VVLVEAGDRLLSAFDAKLSKDAQEELAKLGVEVRLSTRVTDISVEGVKLGTEALPARTVLWAAGVEASALVKKLGLEHDRMGRVKVKPDLTLPGHDAAYAIGDAAHFAVEGGTLPGLAPVAMQQGRHAAENILASIAGRPRTDFHYVDKGIMATVGRAAGIAQTKRLKLGGMLGWLAWLFVHLIFLIGFRNRLLVLIQWAWAYLTYQRSSRLIMGGVWKPGEPTTPDREQALLGHAPAVSRPQASAPPPH